MEKQEHWQNIYSTKKTDEVSWFRPHLDTSLEMIDSIGLGKDASIIDIGCGSSTLMSDLVDRGFRNLTGLDISDVAMEPMKRSFSERAQEVR